jgi:hypothetical protein
VIFRIISFFSSGENTPSMHFASTNGMDRPPPSGWLDR